MYEIQEYMCKYIILSSKLIKYPKSEIHSTNAMQFKKKNPAGRCSFEFDCIYFICIYNYKRIGMSLTIRISIYSQTFLCLKSKQTNNLTICTSSYPKKCFFFRVHDNDVRLNVKFPVWFTFLFERKFTIPLI